MPPLWKWYVHIAIYLYLYLYTSNTYTCTSIAKLVVISSNCPPLRKSELLYLALLSKTKVHQYSGGNQELGTACGKYFRVSAMAITDIGDSDIIRHIEESESS